MSAASLMTHGKASHGVGLWAGKRLGVKAKDKPQQSNKDRPIGRINWPAILRSLWPTKPALELSFAAGCSQRHAERVMAGQRGLSDASTVALIRSPFGLEVLRRLMRGSEEPWFRDVERALEMHAIERRKEELRREIAEMERRR